MGKSPSVRTRLLQRAQAQPFALEPWPLPNFGSSPSLLAVKGRMAPDASGFGLDSRNDCKLLLTGVGHTVSVLGTVFFHGESPCPWVVSQLTGQGCHPVPSDTDAQNTSPGAHARWLLSAT